MLTTLEEIVDRVVREYEPDRIILFGSHATGHANAESDIDLLVVKQTADRPLDRRITVERLLADRALPLDIHVYTPEEMRKLFSMGDPFIEEILEKGRLVYMRNATKGWMRESQDDADAAAILFDHVKYRGACVHSQQSVEKALKALLLEKAEKPPRTHDVVELLHRVQAAGWQVQLNIDDAVFLNSVYRGRYPTDEGLLPHGEPTREDAHRAVTAAGNLVRIVQDLLAEGGANEPQSN